MLYIKKNNYIFDESDVRKISGLFGFSPLISRILLSRGMDESGIEALIGDGQKDIIPHEDIPNVSFAAERIEEAMMAGEKIAVFGDYDADGICGTSIIVNSFRSFGYDEVTYYIPNRISEGYGLNNFAIDQIKEMGCTLIITVDCGISNIEETEYARSSGIEVIVTDHHIPGEKLPDAIIVNPRLSDDIHMHNLCGAVVALKLMCVLFDEGVYYENCALAAIATIADMVDLTGENRYIVKAGLERINSKADSNINCLLEECVKNKKTIKADDISFFVAPAINAAGRLDQADKCVELFTGTSTDPGETAAILAHDNYNRRKIEKETLTSALEKIEQMDLSVQRAIMLCDKNWHQGVLGIAASKIKNIYFRPVILFTENEGELVGSARSIDGVNIHEAIDFCSEHITRFGGHFMAAGLSLAPQNLVAFKSRLEEYLGGLSYSLFRPLVSYDAQADTGELDMAFIGQTEMLEPFGKGNPAPVLLVDDADINGLTRMGDSGAHFRCTIKNGKTSVKAVAFSSGIEIYEGVKYQAVISPQKNEWNSSSSVQAVISDIKPHFTNSSWEKMIENKSSEFMLSLSQAYYGESNGSFSDAGYEDLLREIETKSFAVLVLAVDAVAAHDLKRRLGDVFETLDIRIGGIEHGKTNYNTLLLAPDIEKLDTDGYSSIYIVSRYDVKSMYGPLQAGSNVYIICDNIHIEEKQFKTNVERLRDIYITLKKAILEGSAEALFSGRGEIPEWETRMAARIFLEAGLILYDIEKNQYMLTDRKKADITDCPTYKNIMAGG